MEDYFERLTIAIDGDSIYPSSEVVKQDIPNSSIIKIKVDPKNYQASELDIIEYCLKYYIKTEDNRSKNGAFWVYHRSLIDDHAKYLKFAGLKYKAGRGWWFK